MNNIAIFVLSFLFLSPVACKPKKDSGAFVKSFDDSQTTLRNCRAEGTDKNGNVWRYEQDSFRVQFRETYADFPLKISKNGDHVTVEDLDANSWNRSSTMTDLEWEASLSGGRKIRLIVDSFGSRYHDFKVKHQITENETIMASGDCVVDD
jgi:hypothetical protein